MSAMTAALTATPPATGSAAKNGAKATGAGDGESNAFARALQRRQAADDGAGKPRSPADDTARPAPEADAGQDRPAPAVTQDTAPEATLVDGQQASPAWPPVGLAGLLGFADDAAPSSQMADDAALPDPAGLQAGAGARDLAPAAPAALSIAPALSDTALPDSPAPALAGPALESAAPTEGGEPAPIAFVVPTPAALREPPPLLASPLPPPEVGADDFEARFGAQLEWMADRKIGEARIRVTPNDLGPVEVRLHLDGDRIRADFVSANAETRQALEQGLPRLRDLLGEHGFQLAHANVGGDPRGDAHADGSAAQSGAGTPADETAGSAHAAAPRPRILGLLDAYA